MGFGTPGGKGLKKFQPPIPHCQQLHLSPPGPVRGVWPLADPVARGLRSSSPPSPEVGTYTEASSGWGVPFGDREARCEGGEGVAAS